MQNTIDQRLHRLYIRLTAGTSTSVETAWLVARIAIVLIGVTATYSSYDGLGDFSLAVQLTATGVISYSLILGLLLRRGHVRAVFSIGFILDNLILLLAWWFTTQNDSAPGSGNDMWLILMPFVIVGVARIGPKLGLAYVAYAVGVLFVFTIAFEPANSQAISQLPVRMVFLGIVGALGTWLVSELNMERQSAEELLIEAETLTAISRVVGSSLDPAGEFSRFAPLVRALIAYDILMLAETDRQGRSLRILNLASPEVVPEAAGAVFELSANSTLLECFSKREPHIVDAVTCTQIAGMRDRKGATLLDGTRSIIVSGLVTGEETVGILLAGSKERNRFDRDQLRILARIAEIVSASMTNLQVYAQAIQLANEREARLILDATNRRLQEDNEARTFFLSAVSHELRTPLTSIIAFNDLLLRNRNNALGDRELKHLELIRHNSKQLAALVDDLLDLSYIGSNKIKLNPEELNPSEAIEQIAASVESMFSVRNQHLRIEAHSGRTEITADSQRLSQIVANLLSNASKYSPEASEIVLTWSVSDGIFHLSVRDNGSGISDDEQAKLFQPFFRSVEHRAQKIPGTGLGLVIAKSLLEAHGGGISVTSSQSEDAGSGTEARIWFPADGSGISKYFARSQAA